MASGKKIRIKGQAVVDRGDLDLDAEEIYLADGTRLTEARAEELAAEVLQRAGRGRPSLTAPGQRSPQLRVSVPAELREQLQSRADKEHTSVSQLTRKAIERYLAS